jgi:protein-disulfide isomerase
MPQRFERVTQTVLVCAALAIAVALVHREFSGSASTSTRTVGPTAKPTYLASWKEPPAGGILLGNANARIKIAEFADFECPYCRSFDQTVRRVLDRRGSDVAVVFYHFPLRQHRFARPAARAAECAATLGRFGEMVHVLYLKQDSLGLKPWWSYASEAGVSDSTFFDRCVTSENPVPRINQGLSLGAQVGIQGTPTVIVGGWKLTVPPSDTTLDEMITRLLAGSAPVKEN